MRPLSFLLLFLSTAFASDAVAQTTDPIVMVVNGKPVTRSEFEYSYNKNRNVEGAVEQKTVAEYAEMYVNYKLKVAAAEAARMDTLTALQKEFRTYRDMQLTPYLVDEAFVDSVARSVYDRTSERLGGQDLILVSHILLRVPQKASEAEKEQVHRRADSLYAALQAGADFGALAKQYSADPGTADKGGQLPWIGPGNTLKEFETAAYALQPGELSRPVLSPVGYHLIRMNERKPFGTYAERREEILQMLKQNDIEEAAAKHRIEKLIAASGGRLTREAILDSVLQAHVGDTTSLKYLVNEYYEGLLSYEIGTKYVWGEVSKDEAALQRFFKQNKQKYAWTEPRFKGFVVYAKNKKQLKALQAYMKKVDPKSDWRPAVKAAFNKDSVTVSVAGSLLCKVGENPYVDAYVFKKGAPPVMAAFPFSGVVGKKLSQPKSFEDVKAQIVTDYQQVLEQAWVEQLRRTYPFSIDSAVLSTVNNH